MRHRRIGMGWVIRKQGPQGRNEFARVANAGEGRLRAAFPRISLDTFIDTDHDVGA